MLAVSRDTLPGIYCRQYQVPDADPPYLSGASAVSFRIPGQPQLYPVWAQYSFYVPPHEVIKPIIIIANCGFKIN